MTIHILVLTFELHPVHILINLIKFKVLTQMQLAHDFADLFHVIFVVLINQSHIYNC